MQFHGGISVTWEHDIHLYLRRATVNRAVYGTPEQHYERICSLLGL
jgi:alkylation response protein AidB-like acyl-CoA dehydrogenase